MWSWGNSSWGQCGRPDLVTTSTPVQVPNITNNYWTQISAGFSHNVAIHSNGTLWAWGRNIYGELGNNTNGFGLANSTPVQIGNLSNWAQVFCGYAYSLAIQSNNTLWAWGYNIFGQLGLSNSTNISSPVQVGNLSNWSQISAGYNHVLAIQSNGTLWSWGNGNGGALGTNSTTTLYSPIQVGALSTWVKVAAGESMSLALQTPGASTLWSWGLNSVGQL
jgi:alpha-tubulin suppressor-like RCC1 family protein